MLQIKREKVLLSKLGREVFINPISINDDEWMQEQFGAQTIEKAFTTVDVQVIFSIFWRLLDNDSKRTISKAVVVEWEGMTEKTVEFDDPVEKLKRIVSGAKEIMEIMTAIINTRKNSMPDIVLNEKKSLTEDQSSQMQKSSTSLPANTAQTLKDSETSQEGNLVI
jgi:hypothetical protein